MAPKALPSQEVLRQLLDYDPGTGIMTWRARGGCRRWNTLYAGQRAFYTLSNGYLTGRLFGRNVRAHRVIWALHHGDDPLMQIDHINGCKTDNRIANLRLADAGENARNRPLRRDNKTGTNGVLPHGKKFRANIRFKGKIKHLGTFDTVEAAIAARNTAELQMGFHKNHGREALK